MQTMEAAWLAFEGGTNPKELELALFFASAEGLDHLGARKSAVCKVFEAGLRVLDPQTRGALLLEALNNYGCRLARDDLEHAHRVLLEASSLVDHHLAEHPATALLVFYNLAHVEIVLAENQGPLEARNAGLFLLLEEHLRRMPLQWATEKQRLDIEALRLRAREAGLEAEPR
jgi:hypothetical protein